ncbi:MAG: CBS domain-containing protein [Myxococcota bacterium]
MSLERFCRKHIVSTTTQQSALEAAQRMNESHVGAVVVTDDGKPVGMLTDRDLVMRVVAEGRDAARTPVGDIMSRDLAFVYDDDNIDSAAACMRQAGVRRLPILHHDGTLAGMVTLDDLMVLFSAELSTTAGAVRENRGP